MSCYTKNGDRIVTIDSPTSLRGSGVFGCVSQPGFVKTKVKWSESHSERFSRREANEMSPMALTREGWRSSETERAFLRRVWSRIFRAESSRR